MWLLLALIGHIGNALVFLSDKASIEKRVFDPRALALLAGMSNVVPFFLIPWFLRGGSVAVVGAAVLSGALFFLSLLLYFFAVDRDEISRVVPTIGSIAPLFIFFFGFFLLGEGLSSRALAAFFLLLCGGILVEFRAVSHLFSANALRTFSLEIGAALVFAAASVLLKYSFNESDDISAFLWSRIGFAGAAVPLIFSFAVRQQFFSRVLHSHLRGNNVWFIGSRILGGISPLILTAAVALGSVVLVNAVQGVQYVFLFVLALLFSRRWPRIFQEHVARDTILQKIIAIIFIMVGLFLLV